MELSSLDMPEKERKILEAATAIISQKGFSASTTREIAQMAGVAEGTIFRYFKTKKDILKGILIKLVDLVSEPIVLEGARKVLLSTGRKDLRTVMKAWFQDRLSLVESLLPMLRIVLTEAMYHEDIRDALYENIVAKEVEISKVFHEEMVKRGLMNPELDLVAIARSAFGNLIAFFMFQQVLGNRLAVKDLDRELENTIDVMMFGIAGKRMVPRRAAR